MMLIALTFNLKVLHFVLVISPCIYYIQKEKHEGLKMEQEKKILAKNRHNEAWDNMQLEKWKLEEKFKNELDCESVEKMYELKSMLMRAEMERMKAGLPWE